MGAQRFQMAFLIYFTKLNIYSTKYSMKNNNLKFCAFAAVLIIAVAGITFTSCNKDEKESRMEDISKAVGTWSCIRSTETYQGVNQEDLVVDGKVCINMDGTYTSTIEAIGYKGTYSYDGKRIEVTKSSGESFMIEISINNRRMTWRGIYKNGTSFIIYSTKLLFVFLKVIFLFMTLLSGRVEMNIISGFIILMVSLPIKLILIVMILL